MQFCVADVTDGTDINNKKSLLKISLYYEISRVIFPIKYSLIQVFENRFYYEVWRLARAQDKN